jgi:hypothetical protein
VVVPGSDRTGPEPDPKRCRRRCLRVAPCHPVMSSPHLTYALALSTGRTITLTASHAPRIVYGSRDSPLYCPHCSAGRSLVILCTLPSLPFSELSETPPSPCTRRTMLQECTWQTLLLGRVMCLVPNTPESPLDFSLGFAFISDVAVSCSCGLEMDPYALLILRCVFFLSTSYSYVANGKRHRLVVDLAPAIALHFKT